METKADKEMNNLTQLLNDICVSADRLLSKARSINLSVNGPQSTDDSKDYPELDGLRPLAEKVTRKLTSLDRELSESVNGLGAKEGGE